MPSGWKWAGVAVFCFLGAALASFIVCMESEGWKAGLTGAVVVLIAGGLMAMTNRDRCDNAERREGGVE